jgi:pyruvate dehydrogenase E2 component (dihydrolipoamide acetyltransferase)
MPLLVKMPKWGMLMKAGTVTAWLHAEGDAVAAGDPLFTVETDKAINDVEAPGDGVLRRIVADTGSEVAVAGPVAVIATPGETLTDDEVDAFVAANAATAAAAGAAGGGQRVARAPRPAERDAGGRVTASPAARKRARELGIDLATVTATGPGGRVTSEDVERAAGGGGEPAEQWIDLGGNRVYVLSAGPVGAPPVLLLHGIGGSAATWQGVLEPLAIDHHVVAVDFPAHGRSDVPERDLTVAGLAATIVELLAALGLDRATLVGHSLGGAVALQAALVSPDRVARLVLVDSAALGEDVSVELVRLLDAPPGADASRALLELFFEDRRLVLDAGVAEHHAALSRPGAHAAIGALRRDAFGDDGTQVPLDDRLAELRQPVLVIWGDRDRVFPVAHAERARAALPGAELRLVAGAGHVPQVEDPAAFADILTGFLERTGV